MSLGFSGKLLLNIRPLDLRLIVQAALDILQLAVEAKNIQIVSSLSSITVLGDIDRLQQVLWNLLSNAIKFTPAGGRVEITLLSVGDRAKIQISDTGQGIGADFLPHIFDRFRQGDSSTTKAVAGLGLGLSIVRHLVELHGGEVQAQSPGEGQGATLTVWLPLQSPIQQSTPPSDLEPFLNAKPDNVPALAGLKILAVDDDIDTLELLKFVLENYGAQVLTVTSVKDAIAALSETSNRYDVLISDIAMPESDGYSLIRQVRSLGAEASGQIPAIALTAYASEREQQKAIEAGFQIHIAKPVEPVQMAWVIANLVQGV